MNENKVTGNTQQNNNTPVSPMTSPISQGKLVSRVNALTSSSASTPIMNPQNLIFNNEKNTTLNYKYIVDELISISEVNNIADYDSKIFSMVHRNIEVNFFAIGLFKEKSNCINLKLQDKFDNNYSTKVFLKDEENPIVQVFKDKKIRYTETQDYLNLSCYKNYSTAIIPLISVNKCIGVFIVADPNARQSAKLYSLIANHIALVTHNFELVEKSEEYVNTDALTLLYNHRGFQEILSNEISRSETNKTSLSIFPFKTSGNG